MFNPFGGGKYESSSTTSQRRKRDDDSKSRRRASSPDDERSATSRRSNSKRESSYRSDKRRDGDDKSRNDQARTRSPKRRSTYDGETSSRATTGESIETTSRDSKQPPRKRSTVDNSESQSRAEPDSSSTQALVPNQFPDQAPLDYSVPFQQPPQDSQPTSYGLAADYYGDTGESVQYQPGVRPHTPIVMGMEPHLLAASASPNPPEETGQGSAQEFYAGNNNSFYTAPSNAGNSVQSSSKPSKLGYGAAGLTAASAYATTQVGGSSPRLSASGPSSSGKPPKQPSSGSNLPYYAAGAAGVAGASAAAWHHHQQHHQSSQQSTSYSQSGGPTNPTAYAQQYPSASADLRENRGPLGKFTDWWKDHEDIRKMEEYTEYIGVCKYCFDPQSSPRDAPRRHTPGRKQSREFKNRTRVNKSSRYAASSSSSEDEKSGVGWLTAGLAGYGLAKAAKSSSTKSSKRDGKFDDYPIMTGQPVESRPSPESSKIDTSLQRRSSGSYAVVERDSERESSRRKSSVRKSSDVFVDPDDRVDPRRRPGFGTGAAVAAGAAVGAAALASTSGSRKGSRGVSFSAEVDESGRRAARRESYANVQSSSVASDDSEPGFFKSLFSPSSKKKRNRESNGKRPMYGLSNTSVDSKLAYGSGVSLVDDKKRSKGKRRSSTEGATEALIGLGTATAALAAAESGRKRGSHSAADLVAVKEPRKALTINKKEKMHEEALSSDGGWESASEDDASSSVSSSLAFGSHSALGRRVSARSSSESLSSNASGAGNWDWRWNKKANRRKNSSSRTELAAAATGTIAAAGIAGAVLENSVSDSRSKNSVARPAPVPLQHVEPVPTSDPNVIDAAYRDASFSYPSASYVNTQTSRVPIQQPKPLSPPKGLPDPAQSEIQDIASQSKRRRSVTWKDTTEEYTYPRRRISPPSNPISPNTEDPPPRRRSSQTIPSSSTGEARSDREEQRRSRRDSKSEAFPLGAAVVGAAATTMAAGALYNHRKSDTKDDSEGHNRSSDPTPKHEHEPVSYYYPPDLTYQASKPLANPASETDRRKPINSDIGQPKSGPLQYDDAQRPLPPKEVIDARNDAGRSQYDTARTEVHEPRRSYTPPDEAPAASQYSAQTIVRAPKSDGVEAFPSLAQSNNEEYDNFDDRVHHYEDKRRSVARDVSPRRFSESQARHVQDPVNARFETRKASDRRQSEPIFDDDIFDPDYFKRPKRDSVGRRQEEDADRVVKDLEARYSQGPTDQAAFFSPPDLTPSENVLDSRVDADISSDTRPRGLGSFGDTGFLPNQRLDNIPRLQVIAPTPPESTSGSVRGDRSASPSPVRKSIQFEEPAETKRKADPSGPVDKGDSATDNTDLGQTAKYTKASSQEAASADSAQERSSQPRPRRSFFDVVSGIASGNNTTQSGEQPSAQGTKNLPPDDSTGNMPGQFIDDTAVNSSTVVHGEDDTTNTGDQGDLVSKPKDIASDYSAMSNGYANNDPESYAANKDRQAPSQDSSSYSYGESNEGPQRKLSKKQKRKEQRRKASSDDYNESPSTSRVTFDTDGRNPRNDRGEDPAVGTSSLFQAAKVNNTSPMWPLQTADAQKLTCVKDNELANSSREVESMPSPELHSIADPVSKSPPISPLDDPATETPGTVQTSYRPGSEPSSTAIPFRFRRNPYSPTVNKESPASTTASPITPPPVTPTRTRQSRPGSIDFRTSGEFRPLYLLERNRKIPEPEENLPSLPSSRTSSVHESEDDYESANESPTASSHLEHMASPLTIEVPKSADDEHYLDSQQTTPRAGFFGPDISDLVDSPSNEQSRDYIHGKSQPSNEYEGQLSQEEHPIDREAYDHSESQLSKSSPSALVGLGVAGVTAAGLVASSSRDRSEEVPEPSTERRRRSPPESPTTSVFSYQVSEFPQQDVTHSQDKKDPTFSSTDVSTLQEGGEDEGSTASRSKVKGKASKKTKQKEKKSGSTVGAKGWTRPATGSRSSKKKTSRESNLSTSDVYSTGGQRDVESGEWEPDQLSESPAPQRTTSQVMSTAEALEEGEATGLQYDYENSRDMEIDDSDVQVPDVVKSQDRSGTPEEVYYDLQQEGPEGQIPSHVEAALHPKEYDAQEDSARVVSDTESMARSHTVLASKNIEQRPMGDTEAGRIERYRDRSPSVQRARSVSPSQIALPEFSDEDLNDDEVGYDDFNATQSSFEDPSSGFVDDVGMSNEFQEHAQNDFKLNTDTNDTPETFDPPRHPSIGEEPNRDLFDEVPAFLRSRGVVSMSDHDEMQRDITEQRVADERSPTDEDTTFALSRKSKKKSKRKQSLPLEAFEEDVTTSQPEISEPADKLPVQDISQTAETPEFDDWAIPSKSSKKKKNKGKANNERSLPGPTSAENTDDVTPTPVEELNEAAVEPESVESTEPTSVPIKAQASEPVEMDESYMTTKKSKKSKQKKKKGTSTDQDQFEEMLETPVESSAPGTLSDTALSHEPESIAESTSMKDIVEQEIPAAHLTSADETPALVDPALAESMEVDGPQGSSNMDSWVSSTKKSRKKKGRVQTLDTFDEAASEPTSENVTPALAEETRQTLEEPNIEDDWALPSSSKKKKDKKKKRQSLADFITPTTVAAGAAAAGISGIIHQSDGDKNQRSRETDTVTTPAFDEANMSYPSENANAPRVDKNSEQAPEAIEEGLETYSSRLEQTPAAGEWALPSKNSKKSKKTKKDRNKAEETLAGPGVETSEPITSRREDFANSTEESSKGVSNTSVLDSQGLAEEGGTETVEEEDVGTRRSLRAFVTPAATETGLDDEEISGSMKPPHFEDNAATELTRIDQSQEDFGPLETKELGNATETHEDVNNATIENVEDTTMIGPDETEFKNVFGKLKKTKTENYVAPDVFGNNIRSGKAALRLTGGPQPSVIRDEFKESLISQRAAMKAKAEEQYRQGENDMSTEVPETMDAEALIDADEEAIASGEAREPSQSLETAEEGLANPEGPSKSAREEVVYHEDNTDETIPTYGWQSANEEVEEAMPMSSKKSKKAKKAKARAAMLEEQERHIEAAEPTSQQDEGEPAKDSESRDLELVDDAPAQQTISTSISPSIEAAEAQEIPIESQDAEDWEEGWAAPISSKKSKKAKKAKARAALLEDQERSIEASEPTSSQEENRPNETSKNKDVELIDDDPAVSEPISALVERSHDHVQEVQDKQVDLQGSGTWGEDWGLPVKSKKDKKKKKQRSSGLTLVEAPTEISTDREIAESELPPDVPMSHEADIQALVEEAQDNQSETRTEFFGHETTHEQAQIVDDEWAMKPTSKKAKKAAKKAKKVATYDEFEQSAAEAEPAVAPEESIPYVDRQAREAEDVTRTTAIGDFKEPIEQEESGTIGQPQDTSEEWTFTSTTKKGKKAAKKAKARQGSLADTEPSIDTPPEVQLLESEAEQAIQPSEESGDVSGKRPEDIPETRDIQPLGEPQDPMDDFASATTSKKAKKAAKKARAKQFSLVDTEDSVAELGSGEQKYEPFREAAASGEEPKEAMYDAPKAFESAEDSFEPSQSSKSKKKKAKQAKKEAAAAARRVSFDPTPSGDIETAENGQESTRDTNVKDYDTQATETSETQRNVTSPDVLPSTATEELAPLASGRDDLREQDASDIPADQEDHVMSDANADAERETATESQHDPQYTRDVGVTDHRSGHINEEPVEELIASAPLSLRNSKEEAFDADAEKPYEMSEDHNMSTDAVTTPVAEETDVQMEAVSGQSSQPTTEPSTRRESTEDLPFTSSGKNSKKDRKKTKKEKSRRASARDFIASSAASADDSAQPPREVEDDSKTQDLALPTEVRHVLGRYSIDNQDTVMRDVTDQHPATIDESYQSPSGRNYSRTMPGSFDEDEETFRNQDRDAQLEDSTRDNEYPESTQEPQFVHTYHDDPISVPLPEPTMDEHETLVRGADHQYEDFVNNTTTPEQNQERNLDDSTMPTDIVWVSRRDGSPQSHIESPSRDLSMDRHYEITEDNGTNDQYMGQAYRSTRPTEDLYSTEQMHGQKRPASKDRSMEDKVEFAPQIGFEGTTFDPNLILQDPAFQQRRSPPSAALEPASDDFYPNSAGKKKSKKQRKSKKLDTSYDEDKQYETTAAPHQPTSQGGSKGSDFDEAIQAGLAEAGFNSNTIAKSPTMKDSEAKAAEEHEMRRSGSREAMSAQRSPNSPSPTRSWHALGSPARSTEDLNAQPNPLAASRSVDANADKSSVRQDKINESGEDTAGSSSAAWAAGAAAVTAAGAAVTAGAYESLRRSSDQKGSKKKKEKGNKRASQAFSWEQDTEDQEERSASYTQHDEEAATQSREVQVPIAPSPEKEHFDRKVQESFESVGQDVPSRKSSPDYARQKHYVYDSEPDDDSVDPGPRYSHIGDAAQDLPPSTSTIDNRGLDVVTMDDEAIIAHDHEDIHVRNISDAGGAVSPGNQSEDFGGRRRSVAFDHDDDYKMASETGVSLHERVRPPTPAMLGRSIDELVEDEDMGEDVRSVGQASNGEPKYVQDAYTEGLSPSEQPRISQIGSEPAISLVEEGLSTRHTSIAVDQDLEPQIPLEEHLARNVPTEDAIDSRHTSFAESTGSRNSYWDTDVEADQLSGRPLSRNVQNHDLAPIVENPDEDNPTSSRNIFADKDFDSRFHWPSTQETKDQATGTDSSSSRAIDDATSSNKPNSSSPLAPELAHLRRTSGPSSNAGSRGIEPNRPLSATSARSGGSNRSGTPSLRRRDRSASGDLRSASKRGEAQARDASDYERNTTSPASDKTLRRIPSYDPLRGSGTGRTRSEMSDAQSFEGWGDARGSPRSPSDTRPPSLRKRQSMHILDLENRLDQIMAENQALREGRSPPARSLGAFDIGSPSESSVSRDPQVRQKDVEIKSMRATLQMLRDEVARLTERNNQLEQSNNNPSDDSNGRYAALQVEHENTRQQWESTSRELEDLKEQHGQLNTGMEAIVAQEVEAALSEKEAEIQSLREELEEATGRIQKLEQQGGTSKDGDTFLNVRDEDYFDNACQQLCQYVQQWVLRFSKFSDNRVCRISSEIRDEQIETRLDNAILDGSDVDNYLKDRIRRRDVFMSVVMSMIWEFVFTRYLFGMDRDQRQKLKSLEKLLNEVGPPRAVAQWRAVTLSLLSRRESFHDQRSQDSEAIVQEIYRTLAKILPPPSEKATQIQDSLRNVMRLAVDLSIEMRTQRAEYIMLPPLQPEYDTNGDLARKVFFNASLMNERSGETTSNEELEHQSAVVRMVLFPLVVKKGNDLGDSEEEVVVCPAQVLVAKPQRDKKVVRVLSTAMSMNSQPRSDPNTTSGVAQDVNMEDLV